MARCSPSCRHSLGDEGVCRLPMPITDAVRRGQIESLMPVGHDRRWPTRATHLSGIRLDVFDELVDDRAPPLLESHLGVPGRDFPVAM